MQVFLIRERLLALYAVPLLSCASKQTRWAGLLQNKVTLVTGAGGGIGRATALVLAREGAKVLVSDISTRRGEETAALVRQARGEAEFCKADVSHAAEAEALVAGAVSKWGRLDGADNNAGISGRFALTAEDTEENWDHTLAVDLKGVWLCMKYEIAGGMSETEILADFPSSKPEHRRACLAFAASRERRRARLGGVKLLARQESQLSTDRSDRVCFSRQLHVHAVGVHAQAHAAIWAFARDHDFAIVSKDDDFRQLSFLPRRPSKSYLAIDPQLHDRCDCWYSQ